jgi:hypothetical protein
MKCTNSRRTLCRTEQTAVKLLYFRLVSLNHNKASMKPAWRKVAPVFPPADLGAVGKRRLQVTAVRYGSLNDGDTL